MGLFSIFRRADADRTETRPVEASVTEERSDSVAPSIADTAEATVGAPTITPPAWSMLPPLHATSHRQIARTFDTDIGRRLRAQRTAGELLASSSLSHTVDPASHGIVEGLVRVSAAEGMPAVRAGSDGVLRRRVLRAADLPAADAAHPRWPMLARSVALGAATTVAEGPAELAGAGDHDELSGGPSSLQRAVEADATGFDGAASAGDVGANGPALQRRGDDAAPMRLLAPVDAPLTGRAHVARLSAAPLTPAFDAPAVGAATATRVAALPLAAPSVSNVARTADVPAAAPAPMNAPLRRRSIVEVPSATSTAGDGGAAGGLVARSTDDPFGSADGDRTDDAGATPASAPPLARTADPSGGAHREVPTVGRRPGLGAPLDALPPTAVLRNVESDPFAGWNDADPLPLAAPPAGAVAQGGDTGASSGAVGADTTTVAHRSPASGSPSPAVGRDASVPMLRVVDGAEAPSSARETDGAEGDALGAAPDSRADEILPLASARALGVDGAALLDRSVEVGPAIVRIDRSLGDGGSPVDGAGWVARSGAEDGARGGSGGAAGRSTAAATAPSRAAPPAPTPSATTTTSGNVPVAPVAQRAAVPGRAAVPRNATTAMAAGAPVALARLATASTASASSSAHGFGTAGVPRTSTQTGATGFASFGESAVEGGGGAPIARAVAGSSASEGGEWSPGAQGALPLALPPLRRLPADASPVDGGGRLLERLPNVNGSGTAGVGMTALLERESDDGGSSGPVADGGAGTPGPGGQAPSQGDGSGGSGGAGPAAPGATASTAQADTDLDALAGRLYDRIRYRLRRELLDDRERAGLVLDRVR